MAGEWRGGSNSFNFFEPGDMALMSTLYAALWIDHDRERYTCTARGPVAGLRRSYSCRCGSNHEFQLTKIPLAVAAAVLHCTSSQDALRAPARSGLFVVWMDEATTQRSLAAERCLRPAEGEEYVAGYTGDNMHVVLCDGVQIAGGVTNNNTNSIANSIGVDSEQWEGTLENIRTQPRLKPIGTVRSGTPLVLRLGSTPDSYKLHLKPRGRNGPEVQIQLRVFLRDTHMEGLDVQGRAPTPADVVLTTLLCTAMQTADSERQLFLTSDLSKLLSQTADKQLFRLLVQKLHELRPVVANQVCGPNLQFSPLISLPGILPPLIKSGTIKSGTINIVSVLSDPRDADARQHCRPLHDARHWSPHRFMGALCCNSRRCDSALL